MDPDAYFQYLLAKSRIDAETRVLSAEEVEIMEIQNALQQEKQRGQTVQCHREDVWAITCLALRQLVDQHPAQRLCPKPKQKCASNSREEVCHVRRGQI